MSLAYPQSPVQGDYHLLGAPGRSKTSRRIQELLDNLTSSASGKPWVLPDDPTTAHVVATVFEQPVVSPQIAAVQDVKNLSGLTWDQLAQLFSVSRRSLHNWINGQPMTQDHEDVLYRFREILHLIPSSNPLVVRSSLRDRTKGLSVLELVGDRRFDDARLAALGGVVADPRAALRVSTKPLSGEARRARRDTPPVAVLLESGEPAEVAVKLKKSTSIPRRRSNGGQ